MHCFRRTSAAVRIATQPESLSTCYASRFCHYHLDRLLLPADHKVCIARRTSHLPKTVGGANNPICSPACRAATPRSDAPRQMPQTLHSDLGYMYPQLEGHAQPQQQHGHLGRVTSPLALPKLVAQCRLEGREQCTPAGLGSALVGWARHSHERCDRRTAVNLERPQPSLALQLSLSWFACMDGTMYVVCNHDACVTLSCSYLQNLQ